MSAIRVLIIDDEKMITRMLKGFLEDHGFVVETAESAREGFAIMSKETFDAAIVDLRLPDMDGNEVVAKAISLQPGIKCFIHTGSIDYMPSEDLVAMGIDLESIIHKPVLDMEVICRMIEKKVGRK
ncbi:MAG TPA: response regulator [Spirochaetota bacterium]|jgi:DNA-binding response OmpR family regulator|nr:response regulator [Spirochaetota bacterium]HPV43529.1 response regulator [Spirochaetota bacterium]